MGKPDDAYGLMMLSIQPNGGGCAKILAVSFFFFFFFVRGADQRSLTTDWTVQTSQSCSRVLSFSLSHTKGVAMSISVGAIHEHVAASKTRTMTPQRLIRGDLQENVPLSPRLVGKIGQKNRG